MTGYAAADPWQDRAYLFAYIIDKKLSAGLEKYLISGSYVQRKDNLYAPCPDLIVYNHADISIESRIIIKRQTLITVSHRLPDNKSRVR